jgi:hypothetical protein
MLAEFAWRKSSYSSASGQCVEIALEYPIVWVRDSKNATKSPLRLSVQSWEYFRKTLYAENALGPY